MMESVIRLENFYFAYNKSELVLQDIDLEIKKGSFTVVAGPSGAGKTTLCKAMTGIVPFYMGGRYSGDVQVLGESTKGRRVSDIAMRVGLMLEDYESQLVSLTAGEEVAFSLLNHGFAPEEVAERTRKALEDVVRRYAKRAIVLKDGDLVYDGTPTELFGGAYAVEEWGLRRPTAAALAGSLGFTAATPEEFCRLLVRKGAED